MNAMRTRALACFLFIVVHCHLGPVWGVSLTVYDTVGGIVAERSEPNPNPFLLYTIDVPGLADPSQLTSPTGLQPSPGFVTDIFGVTFLNLLGFAAGNPSPFGFLATTLLDKDRTEYDATRYLNPNLRALGYTAIYRTDSASLPESSRTILFLFCTLSALVLVRTSHERIASNRLALDCPIKE